MSGVDITVPDLAALAQRRSEKWASEEPGVLAMTVAEMDFPLAPPVTAVLRAALDRGDVGYPAAVPARLNEAFAGFARRRLGWEVDPEQVTLAPDVVVAATTLLGALLRPGEEVAMAVPAYPPFFSRSPAPGCGCASWRCAGGRAGPGRAGGGAARRCPRPAAGQPPEPDRAGLAAS